MQNVALLHGLIKEMEAMEVFGHVYEELCGAQAQAHARAVAQGQEADFLRGLIRQVRRGQGDTHVFPTVLHDPSGEGLGSHQDATYAMGDPSALLLLPRIQRLAQERASETMLQYIGWLERSHQGHSDAAIAQDEGRSEATIRGGRKRAVDFLIEVAHDLRHGGTTVEAELPAPLQRAAELLLQERAEPAWEQLQRCAAAFPRDPRWFNIAGLVATERGALEEATELLREGLVLADEPAMRAKLLNNLGKAQHNQGRLRQAQATYLRAWRLAPQGAPPLLNLLAIASERRDLQDCRYYANQLVELLRDGDLPEATRATVYRRLSENPLYDWVRRTVAWKGPARWLRRWSQVAAALLAAVLVSAMLQAAPAQAASPLQLPGVEASQVSASEALGDTRQGTKGEGWIQPRSQSKGEGWIQPRGQSAQMESPSTGTGNLLLDWLQQIMQLLGGLTGPGTAPWGS